MSGWLLDTNVISELRRLRPSARVRAFVAGQPLEELFVSTVTFAEIRYGIEAISDPIRRAELNDWLAHKVRPMFVEMRAAARLRQAAQQPRGRLIRRKQRLDRQLLQRHVHRGPENRRRADETHHAE